MRDGMRIPDKAHRNTSHVRRQHRDALQEELVARFRAGKTRRWTQMISPKSTMGRVALTAVAVVGLGIAACAMPTESKLEMGKRFSLTLNADGTAERSFDDLHADARTALTTIESMPGVESVNVNVMEHDNGATQIELMVWGKEIPAADIEQTLEKALAGGDLRLAIDDLSTTVQESWASKLGREFLHIEIGEGLTDEEARAAILEQLAASGQPNARVGVVTDGDTRVIHIDNVESVGDTQTQESTVVEQQN